MAIALCSDDKQLIDLARTAANQIKAELILIKPEMLERMIERHKNDLEVLLLDIRQPGYDVATWLDGWSLASDDFPLPVIPIMNEEQAIVLVKKYHFKDFLIPTRSQNVMAAKMLALSTVPESGPGVIGNEHLLINKDSYEVRVDGKAVGLTYREFELLCYLVERPGKAFSRDELLQKIWDYDYFGGTRTVDVHIQRLRAKLGPRIGLSIKTVRGVGYMYQKTS